MAEGPLVTLARLLGGVVLMRGRLGHQVLGQILVLGTHEVAIAGATVVVAATSDARDAMAQAVLRTAAPALAVRALVNRDIKRLEKRQDLQEERERELADRARSLDAREQEIVSLVEELRQQGLL